MTNGSLPKKTSTLGKPPNKGTNVQQKNSLRPCMIREELEGRFHCWSQESHIVPPSVMLGGHDGGVVSGVLAIVELLDGRIVKAYPEHIQFIDTPLRTVTKNDDIDTSGAS